MKNFFPQEIGENTSDFDAIAMERRNAINCKLGAFAGIFLRDTNRVLMVQLGDYAIGNYGGNPWSLPGGTVDPNERPSHAAAREILEETGLDVDAESMCPAAWIIRPYVSGDSFHGEITLLFTAEVEDSKSLSPAFPEIKEAQWFDFNLEQWLKIPATGSGSPLQPLRRHWIFWAETCQRARESLQGSKCVLLYQESEHMQCKPMVL